MAEVKLMAGLHVSLLLVTVLSEALSADMHPLSILPPAQHSPSQDPRICPQTTEYCFSYDRTSIIGPDNWYLVCDTSPCFDGSNQSPVLINPNLVKYFCDPYHRLGYVPDQEVNGLLENDGYYPNIAGDDMASAVLQGVPGYTDCRFLLDSLHIHVGRAGARHGTENRVKGRRYDGEMHLVNVREGGKESGSVAGQAVVAVFLSTRYGQHNPQLDAILSRLPDIQDYTGDDVCTERPCTRGMKNLMMNRMVNQKACPHYASGLGNCGGLNVSFNPDLLLPPSRDFYYYYGSLTTPTLSESVLWQVMMEPLKINREQLARIRAMETRVPGKYLADDGNLRPTQALRGRRILANCCHNKY
ncbi:carbonic anhydrase 1-like [Haliotis asinina]|uniref:carbonic anhydrase 1-like n=1 Tax=Haliotis asinina TaxID=109174 RepID=UPI003531EE0F